MPKFNEGDEVTVWEYEKPCSLTTVTKVGKSKMTLADGTEWTVRGNRRWGYRLHFSGSYIKPRASSDERASNRNRAIGIVRSFQDWESLSDHSLFYIADTISNFRNGKDQECLR